ncbi:hypothetical protein [Peribacillus muralis]|uniref:hypothetical protein n=1 Tax=Peribacillus muralis TaxID=264697 RepID=UPI003D093342
MGAYIKPKHLPFLEETKEVFNANSRRETFTSEHGDLIALRFGEDRDCIKMFELGEEVAFFAQQIEPCPNPRLEVIEFARDMEVQLLKNDHEGGWIQEEYASLYQQIWKNMNSLGYELEKENSDKSEITKHCANIANFAMMIADNEGEHL